MVWSIIHAGTRRLFSHEVNAGPHLRATLWALPYRPFGELWFLYVLFLICLRGLNGPFNRFAALVALTSLIFVAAYPFMKRITWWPQAWLGLTFNWGVLFGYAAVTATLDTATWLFYAGCFFWTIGYDTLYAFSDIQDDLLIGVKSSALALGNRRSER